MKITIDVEKLVHMLVRVIGEGMFAQSAARLRAAGVDQATIDQELENFRAELETTANEAARRVVRELETA